MGLVQKTEILRYKWREKSLRKRVNCYSIAQSAGAGLSFQVTKYINGSVTLAKPLAIYANAWR